MPQNPRPSCAGRSGWYRLGLILCGGALAMTANRVMAESRIVFVASFAAGDEGAVQAYRFDLESGDFTWLTRNGGMEHPFFMALSPAGTHLYAIHAVEFSGQHDEQVASFRITGDRGELIPLNRQSTRGRASCYLQVDATGKVLLLANYTTGSVATLALQADGSLGSMSTFVQHAGHSMDATRQSGPHAHCLITSPDNRFAYAADLGLDQIVAYRLDAATGGLSPAPQPFVRTQAGAGPRHLAFHPNGRFLYAIEELNNTITQFAFDPISGHLIEGQTTPTLPAEFSGKSACADLKFTPDGRFLYGTNRGHDSIAAYQVDADGHLRPIGIFPSLGQGPQNLLISPNGKWLLCANMPGNNVARFRIDGESGVLSPLGPPVEVVSPACLQMLPGN